ncbi:rubrerythrin [Methanomicrobium sp. W14]|jgi:rubrerythrin|uniref:rubrerythrin family protein n=1 Tax=Methanomicrobium sp. W14 TaxID=2817839 RepID=UPI001AE683B8|nr:rubrerythrin family protein [Methanomicrobium sp. W14]MBP2134287.1 rubrerythrin [Methanomicrobium sp. W14]
MSTMDNAKAAFAGESQANRKYSNFSDKAAADGFPNVAKLFKAASEAEAIHAKRLLFAMNMVGTTEENLKGAVSGETEEYESMYPSFIKMAEEEKDKSDAKAVFTHAMKAEEVHAKKYSQALEAVSKGKDLSIKVIFLCPVCGNIEFDSAPEKCPICGVPKRMFKEII